MATTVIPSPLLKLASDITHSLQHKQEQIAKTQKQNVLLAELDALDPSAQFMASGEDVDVLAEPLPTLPLWRRADRQFWWNEHLLKPFIDAGVFAVLVPRVTITYCYFSSSIRTYCRSCKGTSRLPLFQFRRILDPQSPKIPLT